MSCDICVVVLVWSDSVRISLLILFEFIASTVENTRLCKGKRLDLSFHWFISIGFQFLQKQNNSEFLEEIAATFATLTCMGYARSLVKCSQ